MTTEIGVFIRKKRKEAGMTLQQVSDEAGISIPYLSTIETGKRNNPSAEVLNRISAVLGVSSVETLTVAGYLKAESLKKIKTNDRQESKLKHVNPLEVLTSLEPEVLSEIFMSYAEKSGTDVNEFVIAEGFRKGVSAKESVDLVIVHQKSLLHIYVFMLAILEERKVDISSQIVWELSNNPEDSLGAIEELLDFDAFNLWYKLYFTERLLSNYGDYTLQNGQEFAFDIKGLIEYNVILFDGKILNQEKMDSLRTFLKQPQ